MKNKKAQLLILSFLMACILCVGCKSEKDLNAYIRIVAETQKNIMLDEAVQYYLLDDDSTEEYEYLYNKVDLNRDGIDEVFVIVTGLYFSGSGGSTGMVLRQTGEKFELVSRHTMVRNPILISDSISNGWHDIIMGVSGGGVESSYRILKFDGSTYPLNPSVQPKVDYKNKINGFWMLCKD